MQKVQSRKFTETFRFCFRYQQLYSTFYIDLAQIETLFSDIVGVKKRGGGVQSCKEITSERDCELLIQ